MSQDAHARNGHDGALTAAALRVGYGRRLVLPDCSLEIQRREITALIGPNGSGKSTLLKALARLVAPESGAVYLDGQAIARLPSREVARRLAVLPQGPSVPEELTVGELVEQGRYPHAGPLRMLRRQDHAAIDEALTLTGMTEYRLRRLDNLSGGERQRAWIALALAQATPLLLLDEPTTFLDVGHQLEVLGLIQRLRNHNGLTVVLALHDLNQAARYADRLIAVQAGRIVADGTPRQVLTGALLAEVFHVQATIIPHPVDGIPVCLPFAFSPDPEIAQTGYSSAPIEAPS